MFVVDLSSIHCIDDRADDNGMEGNLEKLMTLSLIVQAQTLSQSRLLVPMESH